jgi:Na+-translocating ferredoxin:NAD+ oxidoreductase RnfG subunit
MKNVIIICFVLVFASLCYSHMSPPVQLVAEKDAVNTLVSPSLKTTAQNIRMNSAQKDEIYKKTGWKPSEKNIRYYSGTDDQGTVQSTVFIISEYTLHGSIRVAVACDAEGKLTGAELLEVSEEAYGWVKPLIDQQYMKKVLQADSGETSNMGAMTKYYAETIAKVVHPVPSLYEIVKR